MIRLVVRYVPDWLPGAKFKRQAKEWKKLVDNMVDQPFEMTKKRMVRTFRRYQID